MTSGSDTGCINVLCDLDGIVQVQALESAGVDWASGESVAPHVGKPLIKTYWFDHLDCDHRELLQLIRKAGSGTTERARVWIRVDEHQLIRAELTAIPLADSSGQARNVLVRTEPSRDVRRRRDLGEPVTRPLSNAAGSNSDILQLKLGVPLLRIELENATVQAANSACMELLDRPQDQVVALPLTELFVESDRRALIEQLDSASNDRTLEVRLLGKSEKPVRLTMTREPGETNSALIALRDISQHLAAESLEAQVQRLSLELQRHVARLRQFEGFFDRAPLGLALVDGGHVVRSNRAFDVRPESEIRTDLAAVRSGDSPPCSISYRIDDADDSPLALVTGRTESHPSISAALGRAISSHGRLALFELSSDYTLRLKAGTCPHVEGKSPTLSGILDPASVDDAKSAIEAVRTGREVEPLQVHLIGGGFARLSLASDPSGLIVLVLEDQTSTRQELDRLSQQVQQQADSLAELQARSMAVDPEQFATAVAAASQRDTQFTTVLQALGAGYFTWDTLSGRAQADERAAELLSAPQEAASILELLAAATHDERRTFEQSYFDAVSGNRLLDMKIHVGPDRRPLRLLGHVTLDQRDGSNDPQMLSCVVLDHVGLQASGSQVQELQRALAIRTAELNAIFEDSRDAIRIVADGTLRHNDVASELLGDNIQNLPEDTHSASPNSTIHSTRTPIHFEGAEVGVVSISSDRSESHQLRRREAEVAALLANTGVAIALLDGEHRFRETNAAFCALTGYGSAHLIGKPIEEFVYSEDGPTLSSEFEAVNSGELQSCTSDVRLVRRDESTQWVHLTVTKPRGDANDTSIILAQDVQELRELRVAREQLTHELQEATHRYERVAATVGDAVLSLTADGRIAETNGVAKTLFGLGSHENLSHLQFVAPETGNVLRDPLPWRRPLADRAGVLELKVIRPDGESFIGRFKLRSDESGIVTLSVSDVSRLHTMQEELQKAYARIVESHTLLQSRTRQLERNFVSAVQQLGASISAAYGAAKALRNDARLPRPLSQLGSRVVDAFRVHRRLVQYFSASATSHTATVEDVVDVHVLANEAAAALAERYNIAGRLQLTLDAPQYHCRADGALLRHAFWSVFAHAVGQSGKTTVTVASQSLETTRGEGKLRIELAWPGEADSAAELNLADALVQSCGGTFTISAADGLIKLEMDFTLASEVEGQSGGATQARRHVLLVEDHESTARVLRRQLERLGCVVSHANDLAAAGLILEDRTDIDLLVCDLTLPDDDLNARLANLLRKLDLPAIALRSYGGVEAPEDLIAMGFVDHIDKPVDLNALSAVISRFTSSEK